MIKINTCIVISLLSILVSNSFSSSHISGFVTDNSNGEKLSYANVYLEGTSLGSATSEKGYYVIQNVPQGKYTIVASYLGYKDEKKEIEITKNNETIKTNFELTPEAIKSQEVKVTAKRISFERNIEGSKTELTVRDLKTVPKFFEGDLIKILQTMPGVITLHDLSNKLYIRGGSPDENLVLLDGITIYNASTHLLGLFSTFNPDAVADVKLFSGSFPSRYGDRLSSVIDVTTKEGNTKKYTGSVSTGILSSKAIIEGPIPKGSFLLSGRRTYMDLIVWGYSHIFPDKNAILPYYFYDLIGKINFNPSQENKFNLTAFGGADVVDFSIKDDSTNKEFGKISMNWGNRGVSGRWRKVFTPKLYGEITGVTSNFFTDFNVRVEDEIKDDSTGAVIMRDTFTFNMEQGILDYSLKGNFSYFFSPKTTINTGIDWMRNKFTDHWEMNFGPFDTSAGVSNIPDYTDKISAYIEDKVELSPLITFRLGARAVYYSEGNQFVVDPSLGIKYLLRTNTALKCETGRYHQFLYTINSQESFFSLYDMWRPLDEKHKPPEAYHFTLGLEQWIGEDGELSIEGYYKRYNSLLIPPGNAGAEARGAGGNMMVDITMPSESLKIIKGYATGLELQYKKTIHPFHGWANYSLGFTKRELDSLSYFPIYDKRHNFNLVLGAVWNKYTFNLKWYLTTGSPFAEDIARYRRYTTEGDKTWAYIKGTSDAYRLPASHRLDLEAERSITLPILHWKGSMYFGLINVYVQKNVLWYEWETEAPAPDDSTPPVIYDPPHKKGVSILNLPMPIPNFGITFNF